MLGLGMASAHAPMMFQKAQYWPRMLERIPVQAREQLPKSARVELASPAVIEGYIQRIDSDNLRSGTGEVRAWISVAGAMRRPATVVDYVPAHCTQTGCGFVYWPAIDA